MPAISEKVLTSMKYNNQKYLERYLKLHPVSLTHDEYLDLLCNKEHHVILRDAAKYADVYASERWVECKVPVDFPDLREQPTLGYYARSHNGKEAPLIPRDIAWHGDAPAAHKVVEWLAWRIDTGKKAALVEWLLSTFREWESAAKVRFVWPAIMQLCRPLSSHEDFNPERLEAWGKRNHAFKAQTSVPAMSREVREALKVTSQWLTACALLPEDMKDPPEGEVSLNLHGVNWFTYAGKTLIVK